MNLIREVSDHIMDCVEVCVFGQTNLHKKVEMNYKGKHSQVTLGEFLKIIFIQNGAR